MFKRAILILLLLASQSLAANKYVKSGAAGAADGSTWADAYTTLAAAFAGASAGDTIYVSDNHAETKASAMTLTSPGTAASPCRVLCVDDSAEPPTALATTATVSTTGTAGISFAGMAYCYGIRFCAGDDSGTSGGINFTSGSAYWWRFDTCVMQLKSTSAAVIQIGATSGYENSLTEWINTSFDVTGSTGSAHGIRLISGVFIWRDTATALVKGASSFGNLFSDNGSSAGGTTILRNLGLSAGASYLVASVNESSCFISFENCRLASGQSIENFNADGQGGLYLRLVNCDSDDTNYRYYRSQYEGTITQETTIVRTGGATDGTTPISRKMVTTANSKYFSPLESDPILFWNETTGSNVTVTVPVITDNVTLTDAEAWVEVEYLGTSGFPIASTSTDRSTDVLASASNQTTDATSTWTTTGLTTPVKQELSVTFTPQEKGVIRARVMLAKASTTMYFDPEILTTSGRTYMVGADGQVNEGASGSNTIDPLSETIPGL